MGSENRSKDISERLRELRKDKGKSQEEIADLLSISRTSYSKYENGHHEPGIDTLIMLSEYYGITIDYILCNSENRTNVSETTADEQKLIACYNAAKDKELVNAVMKSPDMYRLTEKETQLIEDYRKSTKNGKAAICEFAEFTASKNKRWKQ